MVNGELEIAIECPARNLGIEPVHQGIDLAKLDHALEAAKKGFAVWRATAAYDRAKIMRKAADLMRERHDAISKILVLEQGKVYAEARAEVITSADTRGSTGVVAL